MATTNAERVKRWQMRTRLKAFLYEEHDRRRRKELLFQLAKTTGHVPAVKALTDFLLAYPRCFSAPTHVEFDGVQITAVMPTHRYCRTEWDDGATICALLDAGYTDVRLELDAGYATWPDDDPRLAEIRAEVEALKDADLWSTAQSPLHSRVMQGCER